MQEKWESWSKPCSSYDMEGHTLNSNTTRPPDHQYECALVRPTISSERILRLMNKGFLVASRRCYLSGAISCIIWGHALLVLWRCPNFRVATSVVILLPRRVPHKYLGVQILVVVIRNWGGRLLRFCSPGSSQLLR